MPPKNTQQAVDSDQRNPAGIRIVTEGIGKENEIYTKRFSSDQEETRRQTWIVLCRDFFQSYVRPTDVVVDIGAGDGHFLKNITAGKKIAVDLSAHVRELEQFGIEVLQVPATELSKKLSEPADIVFMSNFLEHLPSKEVLLAVLAECAKILKPGGKVLILQPNIRYVGAAYWDYIDHHIALTEFSLAEALDVSGFKVNEMINRFLPYTAKSSTGAIARLIGPARLVRLYLKFPILWKFLGHQTFVVATTK